MAKSTGGKYEEKLKEVFEKSLNRYYSLDSFPELARDWINELIEENKELMEEISRLRKDK